MEQTTINKIILIKNFYFYLVSLIGLVMMVISSVGGINVLLKTFVFTKADLYNSYYPTITCDPTYIPQPGEIYKKTDAKECATQEETYKKRDAENRTAQMQREIVTDISMFLVGLPLFILHWRIARKKVE